MTAFQMYGSLMALFALTAIVRVSSKEFNFVLGSVVLAGVISAAFDAYLYHSGQSLVAANAGATRVIITNGDAYIDPNALAASLVLPTALALYFLFNSRFIVLSILMIPVLGILLLGFAASGSRGGFMQLAAVFIYLIVRSRHRLWLATLMIVATITTLLANPGLPGRFADAQQDGGAGRRDIWHIGLYAFHDYWFTGAGIGNFPNAFDQEYIKVYSEYVMGWHWVAHNVPLQIATELGVVGLCVFAFATFMQLRLLHKLALDDRVKFEMRLVLEAACLGLIVSGFSGSNLNSKYVWLAFSAMALFRGSLLSERFVEHHSRSVNNNYEPPLKMSAVEAHIGGI
jgi:O-antigen ligase